jgi:hypothetical protein
MTRHALVLPEHCARRAALQRTLGIGVGLVLACTMPRGASATPAKLDKSAVQYTDAGAVPDQDCDDCIQFVPGKTPTASGTCRIVEGAISPHGHCIAFAPRPHR